MATIVTESGVGFLELHGAGSNSISNHIRDFVQRCDVGDTDAFTVGDDAASYMATVRSRPFYMSGLLNKSGIMAGTLLAKAIAAGAVVVRLIKDYGEETLERAVDLTPEDSETAVMELIDDLSLSEMTATQIEFSDSTSAPDTEWELQQFGMKPREEQTP